MHRNIKTPSYSLLAPNFKTTAIYNVAIRQPLYLPWSYLPCRCVLCMSKEDLTALQTPLATYRMILGDRYYQNDL